MPLLMFAMNRNKQGNISILKTCKVSAPILRHAPPCYEMAQSPSPRIPNQRIKKPMSDFQDRDCSFKSLMTCKYIYLYG